VASVAARPVDRRRTLALGTVAASGVALATTAFVALSFRSANARDAVMLLGFTGLDRSALTSTLRTIALLVEPAPYLCFTAALIGVALARGRVWRAVAVGTVLMGSAGAAQVLKQVLATPRFADWMGRDQLEAASWPSGHATAAVAVALCAVIVAPPAWRAVVAFVGGACAVAVAYATLALTWHYPSDVFGGILLAGLWSAAALAALAPLERAARESTPSPPWRLIAAGVGAAFIAAALVAVASNPVPIGTADRATVAACAFALAVVTLAVLVASLMAAPDD
jgi:membrane-associated phospholipid phosphatase